VLRLIVVPLPTDKNTFAVQLSYINNSIQLFIIYVPSKQLQGQLQTQHGQDTTTTTTTTTTIIIIIIIMQSQNSFQLKCSNNNDDNNILIERSIDFVFLYDNNTIIQSQNSFQLKYYYHHYC
jgi:hypothetical protein